MEPDPSEGFQRGGCLAPQPSSNRVIKANRSSPAARYNLKVLRSLRKAIEQNPEIDIVNILGSRYSERLKNFTSATSASTKATQPEHSFEYNDVRSRLNPDDLAQVLSPLSSDADDLLGSAGRLSDRVITLLAGGDVLYRSAWAASVMVFRVSTELVVKVTTNEEAILNEHQGLSWLEAHRPDIPAPRPHGVLHVGQFYMILMGFISGITLEAAWPRLAASDKLTIKGQLELLLASMRQIPMPVGTRLGGVLNGGCKDVRRGTRFSSKPLYTVREFEDFLFSGSTTASHTYINLLRSIMPAAGSCVFTHGDLRPANIMVIQRENGTWRVVGLIDWESSGWYPEYWDCVKATNNLTPTEDVEWYMFLPHQISPVRYSTQWALDRIWDRSLSYS